MKTGIEHSYLGRVRHQAHALLDGHEVQRIMERGQACILLDALENGAINEHGGAALSAMNNSVPHRR